MSNIMLTLFKGKSFINGKYPDILIPDHELPYILDEDSEPVRNITLH